MGEGLLPVVNEFVKKDADIVGVVGRPWSQHVDRRRWRIVVAAEREALETAGGIRNALDLIARPRSGVMYRKFRVQLKRRV